MERDELSGVVPSKMIREGGVLSIGRRHLHSRIQAKHH
jgi:hypothetical protein